MSSAAKAGAASGTIRSVNRVVSKTVAARPTPLEADPDVLHRYLEDAAHYPGGTARAVARPATVEETAWVVGHADAVLAVGAQSSLTGGATPRGDVVLSTERLTTVDIHETYVRVGAGVTLRALQDALGARGLWFPPAPTFLGATVGGAVSTNAAGPATFKYGSVRRWVRALTVVLANGDVLRVSRGETTATVNGFLLSTSDGERHIPLPRIVMPRVPKCSAGYFYEPAMDLIDLFIGSEGTLGVIVDADLSVERRPAGVCWILASLSSESAAIRLAGDLRAQRQLDVAAIEHIDRRSIAVLREDGADRRLGIEIAPDADVLLLAQLELSASEAEDGIDEQSLDVLSAILATHDLDDTAEIVLPSDHRRAAAFVELREAVPAGVNRRVALAHARDMRIHKTAADMIVPFEHFAQMMDDCRGLCAERDLDLAVWGHISDGNVHPNVIPRVYADVEKGRAMILELARRVITLGGSPLAEHGVGRNSAKQCLLAMLYGPAGVDSMRAVKLSLDPQWKLGAGLLFEKTTSCDAG
jgi:D-lactate dehydrogenase (cytochrome)